jgi:hypothetical protein
MSHPIIQRIKSLRSVLLLSALALPMLLQAGPALAANPPAPGPSATSSAGSSMSLSDPLGGVGLIGILSRLVKTFLGLTGAIALLVFVYAGVMYMTAGGDDSQVTKAREAMKYAFIGLVLIMGAYALTNFYFMVLTQAPAAQTSQPPTP